MIIKKVFFILALSAMLSSVGCMKMRVKNRSHSDSKSDTDMMLFEEAWQDSRQNTHTNTDKSWKS